MREGRPGDALDLLMAFLECEDLAEDPEMRRQFVVALRRLTKPTLLRGLAMLFADEPSCADGAERVMRRFGEDGAEAVIDRIACAPDLASRAQYTGVLRRLPSARDAIVEMVDDDHDFIVERAVELAVALRFSDAERVLGDQLSHPSPRVRRAVARGLAEFPGSAFALDALLRALKDGAAEVRLTAAVALQQRRDARLSAALVERFDEETELEVQLALIVAMGRLGAMEGVQKLVALTSPDARQLRRREGAALRLAAMEALGDARTPQAMVTLQKLLEDRDKDVRETAARLYTRARRQTSTGSIPVVSEP
ncbi:MAG: HEAT repeat domain-containing protein [Gemmatimonadaceae bacterium]